MSKFLSLRRPTTISKLAPFVPQHPDALPREIVPQWADLLPSAKLPDRCCPVHAKDLSRGALGQPVWELPPEHGFDLQDPELRVVRRSYLELHDKHLREFWTEALKKYLKRRELINNEERVMCTLRQLNQYRSFLFQRYRLQLKRLLQKLGSDKAMDDHNAKVQTHMETVPDFEEKLFIRRNRAAGIYSKKMDGWKQTVEKYKQQITNIVRNNELKKQQNLAEGHQRDLKNMHRYYELLDLRKRKLLILKRRLRERDTSLQRRLLSNQRRRQEIKARMQIEHFRMHYVAYLKERHESRQCLESFLTQMQHKVQDRKEMYERKHKKLAEELVRRKAINLTSKYRRRNKAALVQALQRECKKSVLAKAGGGSGRAAAMAQQERIERAIDAAYAIHTAISPTTSSTQIIDTASQFVLDLRDIPIDPLPQDQLITAYVVCKLREAMNEIVERSVQEARALIEQVAVKKIESLHQEEQTVRSSLSSQGSFPKLPSFLARPGDRNQSRVSMGPVAIVEQYETESFSLKKCRNRPPTPVTSVTSLVERTLRQSHEERASISALEVTTEAALDVLQRIQSDSYPLIHVMHSQRRYLEGNLLKYRMIVQPYVGQRVLAALDLERLAIVRDFADEEDDEGDNGGTDAARDSILQRTASALLRFPESNRQYAIALCDTVHLLSVQAIGKIQQILNAP
uniref:Uncharacterized protein n=2 Tax=Anopheles gambiae TaxID=7165 RepID=A0A1S4H6S9_ANOGA